jgi:disulfide bond formation protein DsbB
MHDIAVSDHQASQASPPARRAAHWVRRALSPALAPWLVAAGCALVLAGAHALEAFGMLPCELCLKQREPYWAAIPLAMAAALLPLWRTAPRLLAPLLMAAAAAALVYGAGRAVEHVGVIAHWWHGACSAGGPLSIDDVMAGRGGAPLVACDTAPRVFGISLPIYNFVAALTLAGLAALIPIRALLSRKPTDVR